MGLDFDIFIRISTSVFMKRLACVWPSCLLRCFCHVHVSLNKVGILLESSMKFSFCISFTSLGPVFSNCDLYEFSFFKLVARNSLNNFCYWCQPSAASHSFPVSLFWQQGLYGLSCGTWQVTFQLKKLNPCVTKVI